PISLVVKQMGARSAGNPHAACDVEGTGDVAWSKGLPARQSSTLQSKVVRALIRAAGAKLLFLSKYSPDLNPIEQIFAKLKQLLRKTAPRNFEAICAAIGEILAALSPAECANYLRNSGHSPT